MDNIVSINIMETETLLKIIPPTISLIITSLFGLVVGILIEKFKNKFGTLEFSVRVQKMMPTLSENLGGALANKLKDVQINNLKIITVEVENNNNVDYENLVINFSVEKNASFQGNEGFVTNSNTFVFWTPKFKDYFDEVLNEYNSFTQNQANVGLPQPEFLQNKIAYVLSCREYLIPVLNRKESAIFNFLVEDSYSDSNCPIYLGLLHKSIKLVPKMDYEKANRKNLWRSICIGILFVIIVLFIMCYYNSGISVFIVISGLIGMSYSIIGVLLYSFYKKLCNFFN